MIPKEAFEAPKVLIDDEVFVSSPLGSKVFSNRLKTAVDKPRGPELVVSEEVNRLTIPRKNSWNPNHHGLKLTKRGSSGLLNVQKEDLRRTKSNDANVTYAWKNKQEVRRTVSNESGASPRYKGGLTPSLLRPPSEFMFRATPPPCSTPKFYTNPKKPIKGKFLLEPLKLKNGNDEGKSETKKDNLLMIPAICTTDEFTREESMQSSKLGHPQRQVQTERKMTRTERFRYEREKQAEKEAAARKKKARATWHRAIERVISLIRERRIKVRELFETGTKQMIDRSKKIRDERQARHYKTICGDIDRIINKDWDWSSFNQRRSSMAQVFGNVDTGVVDDYENMDLEYWDNIHQKEHKRVDSALQQMIHRRTSQDVKIPQPESLENVGEMIGLFQTKLEMKDQHMLPVLPNHR